MPSHKRKRSGPTPGYDKRKPRKQMKGLSSEGANDSEPDAGMLQSQTFLPPRGPLAKSLPTGRAYEQMFMASCEKLAAAMQEIIAIQERARLYLDGHLHQSLQTLEGSCYADLSTEPTEAQRHPNSSLLIPEIMADEALRDAKEMYRLFESMVGKEGSSGLNDLIVDLAADFRLMQSVLDTGREVAMDCVTEHAGFGGTAATHPSSADSAVLLALHRPWTQLVPDSGGQGATESWREAAAKVTRSLGKLGSHVLQRVDQHGRMPREDKR